MQHLKRTAMVRKQIRVHVQTRKTEIKRLQEIAKNNGHNEFKQHYRMGCNAPVMVDDICRVCMRSEVVLSNIFEAAGDTTVAPNLAEILTQCTKYAPIHTDALPKKICAACKTTAQLAYRFKRECEQSYRQLTLLLTGKSPVLHASKCVECGTQTDAGLGKVRAGSTSAKQIQKQCPICQRQFSRREHMRRHLAVMHKIVEPTDPVASKAHCQDPTETHFIYKTDKVDYLYDAHNMNMLPVETPFDTLIPLDMASDSKDDGDDEKLLAKFADQTALTDSNVFVQVLLNDTEVQDNGVTIQDQATSTIDELNVSHDGHIEISDVTGISTLTRNPMTRSKRRRGRPPCIKTVDKQIACPDKDISANVTQSSAGSLSPVNTDDGTTSSTPGSVTGVQTHAAKTHQCNICRKWFTTRLYLMRHLTIHERKRYVCKECSQSYLTKDELAAHVKIKGHDKPMLCPECGLRCKTSNILMVHMRRHNGEKPYKCKFCNKGFPRVDDLRVHEKYHTGEKSHFCETCGKGFQRKYNLTIHLRVHTGERPYKCPHCPQAFAQGNDLKAHIRRHTGERFRCELCDAAFLQIYQIRQHKLTQHGIKEEPPTQRVAKFMSPEAQEQQIKLNLQQELPTCAI